VDFTFSEDQLLFQDEIRKFLVNEVTAEKIRELWETDSGRSDELWAQFAELGLLGMTVPEEMGGLGMGAEDFVLIAQECGYVGLPELLVDTVLVAAPLINKLDDSRKQGWLEALVSGQLRVALGFGCNHLVEDAHVADLLLLEHETGLYAVSKDNASLRANESVDPSRKLYAVDWTPAEADRVADAATAKPLIADALNRGALGAAAQSLGLAQRMIDLSVAYTADRKQFGVAIGTFQAVKHRMANVAVPLEYSKAVVHRAAASIDSENPQVDAHVSHAKLSACEASLAGAKNSIQVHGAMGYTWEVDLHIFMKKAWALNSSWGDSGFHKNRVEDFVLSGVEKIGAGTTFA
jgi:alkylation response protein AidB-like acyl-CoA dehydrogenase